MCGEPGYIWRTRVCVDDPGEPRDRHVIQVVNKGITVSPVRPGHFMYIYCENVLIDSLSVTGRTITPETEMVRHFVLTQVKCLENTVLYLVFILDCYQDQEK